MNRKSMIGAFALVATLSAPLAFAQTQTDTSSTDAAAQSTTATDASTQSTSTQATTSNDAAAATMQGNPVKKSWADVDANKDGNLTKAEAAAVPALGQAFDKADANADGSLTPDEYKLYVKGQKK